MKSSLPPRFDDESDDEYEERLELEIQRRGEPILYRLNSILAKLQEHSTTETEAPGHDE